MQAEFEYYLLIGPQANTFLLLMSTGMYVEPIEYLHAMLS